MRTLRERHFQSAERTAGIARDGANKLLLFKDRTFDPELYRKIGHRAIGVVYRPEYERPGNYVPTVVPKRYDAFMYIDRTHALHPLHLEAHEDGDLPETYPFAI